MPWRKTWRLQVFLQGVLQGAPPRDLEDLNMILQVTPTRVYKRTYLPSLIRKKIFVSQAPFITSTYASASQHTIYCHSLSLC